MPHQCILVFCMISWVIQTYLTSIKRNFTALQHSISNLHPNHPRKHLNTYVLSRPRKHTNGGHWSARVM
ncbi:hypothetical protein L208DRAFT_1418225 [Tricholoma matsutake]|nr:hypothetical protein L208DRAFT_1418225 [Tricholoma matsutake 945]